MPSRADFQSHLSTDSGSRSRSSSGSGGETKFMIVNGELYHQHPGYKGPHPAKQKHRGNLHERLGLDKNGMDSEGKAQNTINAYRRGDIQGTTVGDVTVSGSKEKDERRRESRDGISGRGDIKQRNRPGTQIGTNMGSKIGLNFDWSNPKTFSSQVRSSIFAKRPKNPWGGSLFDAMSIFATGYNMMVGLDNAFGISNIVKDKIDSWLETRRGKQYEQLATATNDGVDTGVNNIKLVLGKVISEPPTDGDMHEAVEQDRQNYILQKKAEWRMNGGLDENFDEKDASDEFDKILEDSHYADYIEYVNFKDASALFDGVLQEAVRVKAQMKAAPPGSNERMRLEAEFGTYRDFLNNMNATVQEQGRKELAEEDKRLNGKLNEIEQKKRQMERRTTYTNNRDRQRARAGRQARAGAFRRK